MDTAPNPTATATLPQSGWLRYATPPATVRNVVANVIRKGGAGKTTECLLTADALARMGLNVLLIDIDPQGNLSSAAGCKVQLVPGEKTRLNQQTFEPDRFTVVDVIDSGEAGVAAEAVQIVPWAQFYDPSLRQSWQRGGPLNGRYGVVGIIPCYPQIEIAAKTWAPRDLERLATALLRADQPGGVPPNVQWDVVLIDTPPGGSDIGRQALKAAHWALLVTNAERFGVEAIPQTLEYIADVRENYHHPDLRTLGLILNDYDARRRVEQAQTAALESAQSAGPQGLGVDLWPERMPARGVIADSQDAEAPLSAR